MAGNELKEAHDDSLESLEVVARSAAAGSFLKKLLQLLLEHGDELRVFRVTRTAGETLLSLHPSEAYLHYVAAIVAGEFDEFLIKATFRHGWPILSSDDIKPQPERIEDLEICEKRIRAIVRDEMARRQRHRLG